MAVREIRLMNKKGWWRGNFLVLPQICKIRASTIQCTAPSNSLCEQTVPMLEWNNPQPSGKCKGVFTYTRGEARRCRARTTRVLLCTRVVANGREWARGEWARWNSRSLARESARVSRGRLYAIYSYHPFIHTRIFSRVKKQNFVSSRASTTR